MNFFRYFGYILACINSIIRDVFSGINSFLNAYVGVLDIICLKIDRCISEIHHTIIMWRLKKKRKKFNDVTPSDKNI